MKNSFKNIRGIVFDLDDTLYPQISYKRSGFKIVSAWVATHFKLKQSNVLSELEKILSQYGASYPYMFDRLAEEMTINPGFVSEIVRVFIEHDPQIRCYDGVIPMLSRLGRQYHLGILTDGRFRVQQRKVMALGLENKVDKILCSDSMGLEKPAPELYEWFEQQLELDGPELMYVGDNPEKDFFGANAREWFTVCVMTGEYQNGNLPSVFMPKSSIASVIELEKILIG